MTKAAAGVTILLTAFIATSYGMGIYLFGTLLPDMRTALGLTPNEIGAIAGTTQAGTIIASLLVGFVWPRIGAKTTLLLAQGIIAVAMVLTGFATAAWQLMGLLFILGAMAASSWVAMVPLAQTIIPPHRQGLALGLMASGLAYGVFLLGFLAPLLIGAYGWRSVWIACGALSALLLAIGLLTFSHRPAAPKAEPHASERSSSVLTTPAFLIIALNFLTGLSFHPFQTYLTLLFRDLHHWSMPAATALWSAIGLGGMVGGLVFGLLADRIGAKRSLVLAFAVLLMASLITWKLPLELPVYISMIGFGMAYNAIWGLFAAWLSREFSPKAAAGLMGYTLVSSGLGATSGNYLGGLLTGVTNGYWLLYMLICLAVTIALAITILLPRDRTGTPLATDPHMPPA
ncbi:MFS transporter [Rhizobium alvei]|uniref:MFS transporter n=1 Tax=Rhizobium alvei TaxID=1132659 RepID=A0ABT8YQD8_9HYPH|nr:MFS transporter [Rhizobium alvei]MDO6965573.1 MFS transporter [Rhizobium alvei]